MSIPPMAALRMACPLMNIDQLNFFDLLYMIQLSMFNSLPYRKLTRQMTISIQLARKKTCWIFFARVAPNPACVVQYFWLVVLDSSSA